MAQFQRDLMLMFQNAVMYNDSDHHVYHMAVEMRQEVLEQIQVVYVEICSLWNLDFRSRFYENKGDFEVTLCSQSLLLKVIKALKD